MTGGQCFHTVCKSVTWMWTFKMAQHEAQYPYESLDNLMAIVADDDVALLCEV